MLAKVIDLIERKRKACSKELVNWLKKGEITREDYQELVRDNEQISQILKTTFVNGEDLIQKQVVDSYAKLMEFRKKPSSDEEAFAQMRKLIIEGSENPIIRKLAADIAQKSSQERGMPFPVPQVNRLYSVFPSDIDDQNIIAFISHCEKVAEDIYTYVRTRTVYVPDPPDDYHQTPIYTLEILNFRGDCDDLAILLCSLYRSIGYRTFIGVQPQHVYAGVILPRPSLSIVGQEGSPSAKGPTQYVEVPVDVFLGDFEIEIRSKKMSFNIFDVLNTESVGNMIKGIGQMEDSSEKDAGKLNEELEGVVNSLSQICDAKIFYVDPPISTAKIVEVFKENISAFED